MQQQEALGLPAIEVRGTTFFPASAVAKDLNISRQTLWRWRHEGKIPKGHRYRNGQILFSADEVDAVREFAHRIEPIDSGNQLRLFGGRRRSSA